MHRTRADGRWFDWQFYARAVDAQTANRPVFRVSWDGDMVVDADEEVQGDIVLSPNTWYFLAATYDGAQLKFYNLNTRTHITGTTVTFPSMRIWSRVPGPTAR